MGNVQILYTSTPPNGYRWEIVGNGKVLKSGTAKDKPTAQADAEKALSDATKKK